MLCRTSPFLVEGTDLCKFSSGDVVLTCKIIDESWG